MGDDARVLYSEGSHMWMDTVEFLSKHDKPDLLAECSAVCERSDVVLLVVGLDEVLEGEEGDAGPGDKVTLELPKPQRMLMDHVLAQGKPVIVLNMAGSSIDLRAAEEKAAAILQCWYPGARGGKDIAEIIFGEVSPSGKLPVTFYNSINELPDIHDYSMKNRTYRYFEGTPLYPFGYGLTYGNCVATDIRVNVLNANGFDGAEVTVKVKNTGAVATEDALQLYIKDEDSAFAVRNYSLCAFGRVKLDAGEEKTVTLKIEKREFTSVDEDGNRDIFAKNFTVFAGFSQPDARSEALTGNKCVSVKVEI